MIEDARDLNELFSGMRRLGGYKESIQILRDLSSPEKDNGSLNCPLCVAEQDADVAYCRRCGLRFYDENSK